MDGPSLPRLCLYFEDVSADPISLDPDVWEGLTSVGHSKPHHKLIASNGWHIVAIDERDASSSVLFVTERMHAVSCIHPISGDVIFSIGRRWGDDGYEFYSLSVLTGEVVDLDIPAVPVGDVGEPSRIIILPNEDRIYIGDDGLCRVDSSGAITECWRNLDDAPDPGFDVFDSYAFYEADGYALYRHCLDTQECTLLAGSRETWGCSDGFGANARFGRLRAPFTDGTSLWCRTEGPCWNQWRVVRVGFETAQVETVRWVGVDHDDISAAWGTEWAIFVLQGCDDMPSARRLLRADLAALADPLRELGSIDISEPLRPITFKLAGGTTVQASGRALIARSAYFRDMLKSGFQEAKLDTVDLTGDPGVDKEALSILLHYVELGISWAGSKTDSNLAFRVRELADRYCMPQLVYAAESVLHGMLTEDTVLSFAGRIVGSGSALEDACWAMMTSARERILTKNESCIGDLIQENPELAKKLILWKTGAEADPVRGTGKRRKVG